MASSSAAAASSSSAASAPSPASWDPSTVILEARSIVALEKAGQRDEALARAAALADAQRTSAIAQNLAGDMYYIAGQEALACARDQDEIYALVGMYFSPAVGYYAAASCLAPTCAATAIYHADALAACQRIDDAYAEYKRAASIPDAADPAEYNISMDFGRSAAESKRAAMAKAGRSLRNFESWIKQSYIPREATKVMQNLKSGVQADAVQAVKVANHLAKTYSFCSRTHLLRAYALVEQASLLPPELDNRPMLERALSIVSEACQEFNHSLLIALFKAKLLYQLQRTDDASEECVRAISIRRPDDPAEENVLRITGDTGRKSRVISVRQEIRILLEYLVPGSTGSLAQDDEGDSDSDSDEQPRHHQSAIYAHNALHVPIRLQEYRPFINLQQAPPQRIHFVAGQVVPQEIVNIFALHCDARSKCSVTKTVCHICSFEDSYDAPIEKDEMAFHYYNSHTSPKKRANAPIPLPAPQPALEPLICDEQDCHVRTRTSKDMRLHYYFVHRLPANWWIT